MVIKPNSKIAVLGDTHSADGVWIQELKVSLENMGRADIEIFNCASEGLLTSAANLDEVKKISPDIVFIMLGFCDITAPGDENEKLSGFTISLEKLLNDAEESGIKPILSTCPAVYGESAEEISVSAEKAIPYCRVVGSLAKKHNVFLVEANENFTLFALESVLSGEPICEGVGVLLENAERELGKIIARELF